MTMTRYFSVAAMLYCLLGPTPTAAAPIATGRQTIDINGTHMVVFTYRPAGCSDPTLLRRYLQQPLTIYLGQSDTRDDMRNDYPEVNAAKTLAASPSAPE